MRSDAQTENGIYVFLGRLVPALCAALLTMLPALFYVVHTFTTLQEHQISGDRRLELVEQNQREIVKTVEENQRETVKAIKELSDKTMTRVEAEQRAASRDKEFVLIRDSLATIIQDNKELSRFVYARLGNFPGSDPTARR